MKQFSATGVGGKRVLFVNKKVTPKSPISPPHFADFALPEFFHYGAALKAILKPGCPCIPRARLASLFWNNLCQQRCTRSGC